MPPLHGEMPHPVITLWWFVLPLLAVLGLVVAVRAHRALRTVVPLACAVTAALPYLFTIEYAAPRFLQVSLRAARAPRGRRPVVPGDGAARAVAAGFERSGRGGAGGPSGGAADRAGVHREPLRREFKQDWARTAEGLHRLGVRPPCLVTGHESIPIGYYTGCSSGATAGNNENMTAADIRRTAGRVPVAEITRVGGRPNAYARTWPVHRVEDYEIRVAPGPHAPRE